MNEAGERVSDRPTDRETHGLTLSVICRTLEKTEDLRAPSSWSQTKVMAICRLVFILVLFCNGKLMNLNSFMQIFAAFY